MKSVFSHLAGENTSLMMKSDFSRLARGLRQVKSARSVVWSVVFDFFKTGGSLYIDYVGCWCRECALGFFYSTGDFLSVFPAILKIKNGDLIWNKKKNSATFGD